MTSGISLIEPNIDLRLQTELDTSQTAFKQYQEYKIQHNINKLAPPTHDYDITSKPFSTVLSSEQGDSTLDVTNSNMLYPFKLLGYASNGVDTWNIFARPSLVKHSTFEYYAQSQTPTSGATASLHFPLDITTPLYNNDIIYIPNTNGIYNFRVVY
jgi:hypothetical protein